MAQVVLSILNYSLPATAPPAAAAVKPKEARAPAGEERSRPSKLVLDVQLASAKKKASPVSPRSPRSKSNGKVNIA